MRLRIWAAVSLVALLTLSVTLSSFSVDAGAQYTDALPAGLTQFTIDDQPIDASTVPQVANLTPLFAGRLNTGAVTVALALAGETGDIVQFNLDVDERGRFRGRPPQPLVVGGYTLYVDDFQVGSFFILPDADGTPEAGDGDGGGPRLDIAQVVPFPFDFGDALPNLGFVDGRFYTIDEEAQRTAAAGGDDSRDAVEQTRQSLEAAGWRQRYDSRLAVPAADDESRFETQVSSFVIEYDSAEAADRAYQAVIGDAEAIESVPIGNASQLDAISGSADNTGAAYQALRLTFLQDRILCMVVLADLLDRAPDQAALESAAQAAQGRAAAVLAEQVDGLGPVVQRLDLAAGSDRTSVQEGYEVLYGALVDDYGESNNAREARVANFTGTTLGFAGSYSGTLGGRRNQDATPEAGADAADAGATPIFYGSTLYAFPSDADADAWLAGLADRLSTDPLRGYLTFSVVADAPTYGDASATYEFTRRAPDDATAAGFRVYARLGTTIAAVEYSAVPEVALAAVEGLVAGQLECIERGRCPNPVAPPALDGSGAADAGGGRQRDGDQDESADDAEAVEQIGASEDEPAIEQEPDAAETPDDAAGEDEGEDDGVEVIGG